MSNINSNTIRRAIGAIIFILITSIILILIWLAAAAIRSPKTALKKDQPAGEVQQQEESVSLPVETTPPESTPQSTEEKGAELKPLTPFGGVGQANRQLFDGAYKLNLSADLPQPAAGDGFYAWLVHRDGEKDGKFIYNLLGPLKMENNRYILNFDGTADLVKFEQVLISAEPLNQPPGNAPRMPILSGKF